MLRLHNKENQKYHCTVRELRDILNALPDDAKIYVENHHRDLSPAIKPRIQLHPNKSTILLILPEEYKV